MELAVIDRFKPLTQPLKKSLNSINNAVNAHPENSSVYEWGKGYGGQELTNMTTALEHILKPQLLNTNQEFRWFQVWSVSRGVTIENPTKSMIVATLGAIKVKPTTGKTYESQPDGGYTVIKETFTIELKNRRANNNGGDNEEGDFEPERVVLISLKPREH